MLAAISQVLNECTKPDQATPAALVLQGLHALCKAEVGISEWFCITVKLFYKDGSKNFSILRFFLGGVLEWLEQDCFVPSPQRILIHQFDTLQRPHLWLFFGLTYFVEKQFMELLYVFTS